MVFYMYLVDSKISLINLLEWPTTTGPEFDAGGHNACEGVIHEAHQASQGIAIT
jgi:hypothetical protein